jgi:hypothetical protein
MRISIYTKLEDPTERNYKCKSTRFVLSDYVHVLLDQICDVLHKSPYQLAALAPNLKSVFHLYLMQILAVLTRRDFLFPKRHRHENVIYLSWPRSWVVACWGESQAEQLQEHRNFHLVAVLARCHVTPTWHSRSSG